MYATTFQDYVRLGRARGMRFGYTLAALMVFMTLAFEFVIWASGLSSPLLSALAVACALSGGFVGGLAAGTTHGITVVLDAHARESGG